MSQTQDENEPRKKRSHGSTLVWLLLLFVMIGLGGYGVTNFGGTTAKIAYVGEREVSATDYARAIQSQMNAMSQQFGMQITFEQAQAFGVDRQVLQNLITSAALANESARIGVSVGDETLAAKIRAISAFQGAAGSFDRETYRMALDRANLTESAFEKSLREDTAQTVLQGAIVGGFLAPQVLIDKGYAFAGETRDFSVLVPAEGDLATPVAQPDDAQIKAYYDANIETFTRPEAKRITYIALTPEKLAPDMEVDEKALQDLYQERIDEFVIPEKRLVERLVFPTEDEAKAAKARIDAGESFESLVAERGLTLDAIDMGDVSKAELGAAGDGVFALTEPGITGPLNSDFGPALFRMNGILAAQETTFDQAKESLSAELRVDAARRDIATRVDQLDDILASGAELEDAATEAGMDIATIDYVPNDKAPEGIAAYPGFRAAADALVEGDFPQAILLDDGALVALRFDETLPPAPLPLDQIKDDVAAALHADDVKKALTAQAETVKTAVTGGASLGSQGIVSVSRGLRRDAQLDGTPAAVLTAVFGMTEGEVRIVTEGDYLAVVQLDKITPAPASGDEADELRDAIALNARQSMADDAYALFSNALLNQEGLTLDQTAINAVNAQMN